MGDVSICTVQLLLLPPTDIYPVLYGEEHPNTPPPTLKDYHMT